MANPLEQTTGGRRWQLFFVDNPLVQIEPGPSDDELDWSWTCLISLSPPRGRLSSLLKMG